MKNTFFKQRSFYAVFLSVALSVLLVAGAAGAVTTISANINTGGTLTVSGMSTLGGNVDLGDAAVGDNDVVYLHGTTTVIGAQSFIFGSSTGATIEGQAEGSVYYDSTNKVLRLFDGINWYPVASSTDAGGGLIITGVDTNLIRFNVVPTGYMGLGTTTPHDNDYYVTSGPAILTIVATSTNVTPLRIFSASSTQTANLFEIISGSNTLFVVDNIGNASSTGSLSLGGNGSDGVFNAGDLSVGGLATTTGANGNIAAAGTLTITGATTLNGAVTLGDAIGDLITITGNASTTNSFSIGASNAGGAAGDLSVSGMATTTGTTGDITTVGVMSVGTSTVPNQASDGGVLVKANLDVTSSGTTTVRITSTSAVGASAVAQGGCIEMRAVDGQIYRIFATTTTAGDAMPVYFTLGECSESTGDGGN